MIDQFALALPHFLLALACWRLYFHDDFDADPVNGPGENPGA